MSRVAIIILIWNGKEDTLECLRSLQADTYPEKEIIVVDNGSTDDSVEAIRTQFPSVTILQNGTNLGFTGGNNIGIRYALENSADYIFLLNNDTSLEPDALRHLVEVAQSNPSYGLLTPVIHYFDAPQEIWFADSRVDLRRGTAVHGPSRRPTREEEPFSIPWATGCAMLVRADVIRRLSGFDDRYYYTWEDVDLSLRVRASGSDIVSVPRARIYHKVGRAGRVFSSKRHYYAVRNSLLLVSKHAGRDYLPAAARIVMTFVKSSLRSDDWRTVRDSLASVFRGLRDHVRGSYGPCPRGIR